MEAGKFDVSFIYIEFNNYSTAGTKPNQPVSLESAEKIFHQFIRDKKKRGYRIFSILLMIRRVIFIFSTQKYAEDEIDINNS